MFEGQFQAIWHRPRARAMRHVCCVTAALLVALSLAPRAWAGGHAPALYNRFTLDRMLSFYLVNEGGTDFTVTIRWLCNWQAQTDAPVLVRVLDPNELVVDRHLDPGNRITGTPGWNTITMPVTSNGPGVYQVIVTAFTQCSVEFGVSPEMSWGVYGYPMLRSEANAIDAYVYLPPGLPQLTVQVADTVTSLQLTDDVGIVHVNVSGTNVSGTTALPAGVPDAVWRLTAQGPNPFGVNFGVAPIILCADEATALAIRSSVDVLADGTIAYHKFQIAAHDALEQYRAMDASSFAVSLPSLQIQLPEWLAAPSRHVLLLGQFGVFSSLPATLLEQNLDPASPWFGTIYNWHSENGQERPNPLITYDRLGLTQMSPTLNALAAMYMIDSPFNTLHHDANLRNRIIIAALQEMMMIREHELPEPTYDSYDGGEKAFTFAHSTRWFPWVILDCPGDVRTILVEGLRRYVDHMLLAAVPQTANQWSFIMIGLQNFARGTGEAFYTAAVNRQINWLLARQLFGYGAMQAGYFSEGSGPDTTYSGISLHNLAWLAEDTGHAGLRNALTQSYSLLNHTIAPEPDGTWMGAASYAHRTPDAWSVPQWGAGVAMTADDSAEAGVLLGRTWLPWRVARNSTELQAQQTQLQFNLVYHGGNAYTNPDVGVSRLIDAPLIHVAAWEHFLTTPIVGQLPMKASDRFTRKMGDEFLCVRRPTYYAFLYCGKTMEPWQQASRPSDPDVQYPRNGGGLSMFWTPKFGSSLLSQNWSAYSTNSIIATLGQQTFFEDYWTVTSGLQESQARATINGELTNGDMTFRRQLNSLEDRILCETRLQSTHARTYTTLSECFPYPLDKPDPISVKLYDANGTHIPGNNKTASAIVFRSSANEVHIIAFNKPRKCEFGVNTSADIYGNQRQSGRVLTSLPLQWNANQARVFKWSMKAVKPDRVQQTIRQMIQAMP